MDEKKNGKKIIIFGMILLIIAGIIVVSLKGFNVALMFGKHESVELKIGKEVNLNLVKEICDETFKDKKYVIKELELFGDSVQINIESITDEEKENFINKINEKFETTKSIEDLKVYSMPNRRIRDVLKQYIQPMLIAVALVLVYMSIRFRKIKSLKVIIDTIGKIVLTEVLLFSLIAVTRIPVTDVIIYLAMMVAIIMLIICLIENEKKLISSEES